MDDIQEANPAVFELLADIAAGKDCYVTSSPDTVVQGFRGAGPDLVAELPPPPGGADGSDPGDAAPRHAHRHRPAVAEAWLGVADADLPRAGGQPARRLDNSTGDTGGTVPEPAAGAGRGTVEAHLLPSPVHELRYVAQRILEAQLNDGRELGGHRRDRAQRRPAQRSCSATCPARAFPYGFPWRNPPSGTRSRSVRCLTPMPWPWT